MTKKIKFIFSFLSLCLVFSAYANSITSEVLVQWIPLTISFNGPATNETAINPNPFLDYRLNVTFTHSTGSTLVVPGYYDGGSIWRVKFTPDLPGVWEYEASFRQAPQVAISLEPEAGNPVFFDSASGQFTIAPKEPLAAGFLKWGRLEYVGKYYLKFRDGPYFLKAGNDGPENFLGYKGFDNTPNFKHQYLTHEAEWTGGDPDWNNGAGKGIIGSLNYLALKGVNSIFFLLMNIGGDGRDTWPYVGPIVNYGSTSNDNLHFDLSKLAQWEIVFNHAQINGIQLHFVLNEAEQENKKELDNATLGPERKLFYREMIARFAHHNAIIWNICEEYEYKFNLGSNNVKLFAQYIQDVDPYDHPITVHQQSDPTSSWTAFVGDPRFSLTSFQYAGSVASYGAKVEDWRTRTANAGRPIPINLDEIRASTSTNADAQRKEILWHTYFSGGNIEWYVNPDQTWDNFRTLDALWTYQMYAHKFMTDNLNFWNMNPKDSLLSGETTSMGGGQVFSENGVYAIFYPDATATGNLNLSADQGNYTKRWFNPRTGDFEGSPTTVAATSSALAIGAPPSSSSQDWVVLLKKTTGTPPPETISVTSFTLVNAATDSDISTLNSGNTINLANGNQLNVRANVSTGTIGSVKFGLDSNPNYSTDNAAIFSLAGNNGNDYNVWTPAVGTHTLRATPYPSSNATGTVGIFKEITFTVVNQTTPPPTESNIVTGLTLINATTDTDIGPLTSGMTINLKNARILNIRAEVGTTVKSVKFAYDTNSNFRTESGIPFSFAGDSGGNYYGWTPTVGTHTVRATPYSGTSAGGTVGTFLEINITVIDQ